MLGGKRKDKEVKCNAFALPKTLLGSPGLRSGAESQLPPGLGAPVALRASLTLTHSHTHQPGLPGHSFAASLQFAAKYRWNARHAEDSTQPDCPNTHVWEPGIPKVFPKIPSLQKPGGSSSPGGGRVGPDWDMEMGGTGGLGGQRAGEGRMAAFCKLQGCLLATDNTFGSTWLAKAPETRPARRGTGALPSYF